MRVTGLTNIASRAVSAITLDHWRGIPSAQYMRVETRRRTQRFTLLQPIAARALTQRALAVDVSLNGVRLRHADLINWTTPCPISLEWHGLKIDFVAEPRWTRLQAGEYQS